jgi:hypothetical protein
MAKEAVHLPVLGPQGLGATLRKDNWWAGPLATFLVLTGFIVYATFRAFENGHYRYGPYLSPFYSPFIPTDALGGKLGLTFLSPAMLILPGPASFRLTCYYYRKAYYRAFGMDPPACAVGERNAHKYNGETKLFIFQNLHRFALYVAIIFLVFLWHDFVDSLDWNGHFGMGMGSLVLLANCTLLSLYTFSCHSWRHLIGGGIDSYSTAPLGKLRYALWHKVSKLNENHMLFAWLSLFGVALTDLYIRSVDLGAIPDLHFF